MGHPDSVRQLRPGDPLAETLATSIKTAGVVAEPDSGTHSRRSSDSKVAPLSSPLPVGPPADRTAATRSSSDTDAASMPTASPETINGNGTGTGNGKPATSPPIPLHV
jgi:hypothetical protein